MFLVLPTLEVSYSVSVQQALLRLPLKRQRLPTRFLGEGVEPSLFSGLVFFYNFGETRNVR